MSRFRTALLAAVAIAAGVPTLALAQPPGGDPRGDRSGGGRPDRGQSAAGAAAQAPQPAPAIQGGGRAFNQDRGPRGGRDFGDPGDRRGFGRPDRSGGDGFQRPGGPPPGQAFGGPGGDPERRAFDGNRRGPGGDPERRGFDRGDRPGFAGEPGGRGFDPGRRGYDDGRGPGDRRGFDDWRDWRGERGGPAPGGFRDGGQRFAGRSGWDRGRGAIGADWRQDRRYDWRGWRDQHRETFRVGRYYAPRGWAYGYRRFEVGFRLQPFFYASNYWIDDPYDYRLPPVDGPYRWVRYYNDVLLVDLETGEVVDAIHDFFW